MIFKKKNGELRLIWHLVLLVAPFLSVAFLLRYIPIRIQARIHLARGLSETAALAQARDLFLKNPIGVSIVGILQGLMWFLLIYALIRSLRKEPCNRKNFGLPKKGNGLMLAGIGFCLGLLMYLGYFVIGTVFDYPPFVWSPVKLAALPLILVVIDLLVNGFGEEAAFRAYWQKLLVERHGLWFGIFLASISFILLHLVIANFTIIELAAGTMLAFTFGILYIWTRSIFLVGAMHTTLNLSSRLLGPWPSDSRLLIVNGLSLLIVIILFLHFQYASYDPAN